MVATREGAGDAMNEGAVLEGITRSSIKIQAVERTKKENTKE